MTNSVPHLPATILGYPRIGPQRELKRAVEKYWKNNITREELLEVGHNLRQQAYLQQKEAGLTQVPVNDFSLYDHVLDTTVLLGAFPDRFTHISDEMDRFFVAARGDANSEPLEMTKWFNTNYHYSVPELTAQTQFSLHPDKILAEIEQARSLGLDPRPVILGPVTYLLLSKTTDGSAQIDLLGRLVPVYSELLKILAQHNVSWVQFDEPILVTGRTDTEKEQAAKVYQQLAGLPQRPKLLLATYFNQPDASLAPIFAHADAVSIDLTHQGKALTQTAQEIDPSLVANKDVLVGVVDGRNIWRTNARNALEAAQIVAKNAGHVSIGTSCSLLFSPYSLKYETHIAPDVAQWLAFSDEKLLEVVKIAQALDGHTDESFFSESEKAAFSRKNDPRLHNQVVRDAVAGYTKEDFVRLPFDQRQKLQEEVLNLPPLPITTIGSFPQTTQLRVARSQLAKGEIADTEYTETMRQYVRDCIREQEEMGIDMLVHGEPERNDMVQYFSEQLDGFISTKNGWVQSYGTRCVRPPILYGDVNRPQSMTVDWAKFSQSLTDKPVKGMLTGPITIISWSFVRDDQPLAETAYQLSHAIRLETIDLESAGIKAIQVDEPAFREMLPLEKSEQADYLRWAVQSFRLATSGVKSTTQIHTHMCYSEFGEIMSSILDLDADVTSIEAARSKMEILYDLKEAGFSNEVGPGVYDIHTTRVPSVSEIEEKLRLALEALPARNLWVNPDCGLKTRAHHEVEASLTNIVTATRQIRKDLVAASHG